MPQAKQDLILDDIPDARSITLDISQIKPSALTLMDALDVADAAKIPHHKFDTILSAGSEREKVMLMYAIAWVFARRSEPGLTFDEVLTYDLKITGKPVDKETVQNEADRARVLVGVAKSAGVTTEVAGQMTMAEVSALSGRRRRAG